MEKAAADDSKEAARGTEPSGIRGGALACTRRGEHKGGVGRTLENGLRSLGAEWFAAFERAGGARGAC